MFSTQAQTIWCSKCRDVQVCYEHKKFQFKCIKGHKFELRVNTHDKLILTKEQKTKRYRSRNARKCISIR